MNIHLRILLCVTLTSLFVPLQARGVKNKSKNERSVRTHIDVPEDFGKTHFIVGMQEEHAAQLQKQKKESSSITAAQNSFDLVCNGCIKHVLFSPDDQIQKILLYLINSEKESIKLTAYSFTDGEVAQALIEAHERGVRVEIIADPGCMFDRFGKISLLKENAIMVFVYDPDHLKKDQKSLAASIMHNKFIIFSKNIAGKSLVWTGSFNWTKAAHKRNQENVIILDDKQCVNKYINQFELLKLRCVKPKKEIKQQQMAKKSEIVIPEIALSKKGTLFENDAIRV
jgi:phosphatidylserine/phosphatidylglycerophosphate/cardiolipin synthase-like enzyme